MPVTELVNGVLKGRRRDLARLITLIEDEDSEAGDALSLLYRHTGNAHIIGVTGPPGSGKSSLVTKLTADFRSREKTIGIVCVDPSSPFTGGALLGDRIRMQEHSLDKDVYVRSMGTRGHLGGRGSQQVYSVGIGDRECGIRGSGLGFPDPARSP